MIVKGLTPYMVACVIHTVSARSFGGNIETKRAPEAYRGAVRFTIKAVKAAGPGHRCGFHLTATGKRRRLAAACYHAYGEVIRELLARGATYVQSAQIALERYRSKGAKPLRWTAETWWRNADDMARVNIGSTYQPLDFANACECGVGTMPNEGATRYHASSDWKGGPKGWPASVA